jgi:hypothetical protein
MKQETTLMLQHELKFNVFLNFSNLSNWLEISFPKGSNTSAVVCFLCMSYKLLCVEKTDILVCMRTICDFYRTVDVN